MQYPSLPMSSVAPPDMKAYNLWQVSTHTIVGQQIVNEDNGVE